MGPTKEELEKYFKNNRKYFDELAKNYKITDPDYYNKNIAPFYGYTFDSAGNKKPSPRRLVIMAGLAIAVSFGISMLVFFIQDKSERKPIITAEQIEKMVEESTPPKIDTSVLNNITSREFLDTMEKAREKAEFNHGKFLFKMRKYEEAEEYLKKVPKGHPEYEQVEYMLKEIKKNKKGKK
jgi:hypothetical protein